MRYRKLFMVIDAAVKVCVGLLRELGKNLKQVQKRETGLMRRCFLKKRLCLTESKLARFMR